MVRFASIIVSLVALAVPLRAAEDAIEKELAALVTDVAKVLEKQSQGDIRIGKFTGDGDVPSNYGPEIQRVLIAEFAKKKIGVNKDALIEIKGDYAPAKENPDEPRLTEMFVRINASLVNTKTRIALANIPVFSRATYGNEALAKTFAVPVSLPPGADRSTRAEKIREAIEKPATHVGNALVRSKADSPFAIEMLVVPNAAAADPKAGRAATLDKGLAFVEIHKTEVYRVRIHNAAPFDVAVRLTVDGLDQFVFADKEFCDGTGRSKFQYMVVPAKGSAVVKGWFRNLKTADSFLVTEYAKGAVAQLDASQGEVGVVNAQFFAAFATEEELRKNEGGKDAATGRGDPVGVDLKVVTRHIGNLRDQVSVRYTK